MDHHCIWTNNCLGYNTLKPFMLFNIYVTILCSFGIPTIVHNQSAYFESQNLGLIQGILSTIFNYSWTWSSILMMIVGYGSGAFFGFSISMIYTVLCNLRNNTSMVDQIKMMYNRNQLKKEVKP